MIKQKHLFYYLIVATFILSSCNGMLGMRTVRNTRSASFMPDQVRLNVTMDDYQYISTQEVSVSYKQYFGFLNIFNEINKQPVAVRNINIVNLYGNPNLPPVNSPHLLRALYAAMVSAPDADFVVPVSVVTEEQKMFGGSTIVKTLKVKLYKIKEK